MSITKLRKERTRKQPATSKGKATVAPERARTLTAEEIYQMTEPGNRKRNSEICRELVKMIRQKEEAAQSWMPPIQKWLTVGLPPSGGFLLRSGVTASHDFPTRIIFFSSTLTLKKSALLLNFSHGSVPRFSHIGDFRTVFFHFLRFNTSHSQGNKCQRLAFINHRQPQSICQNLDEPQAFDCFTEQQRWGKSQWKTKYF